MVLLKRRPRNCFQPEQKLAFKIQHLEVFYLLLLQRLDDFLDTHLQVFDVVLLRLQKLLDDLRPLLQHPLLWVLCAHAGGGG